MHKFKTINQARLLARKSIRINTIKWLEAAAEDGVRGVRADDRAYRDTPGDEGSAGSDGKAIYFSSSSVANSSDIDAANVGGRNGGTATGSIN